MVHRDLKIGLVVGLVLVIGIVIKLATNPRLNPEARIMQTNNSTNPFSPVPYIADTNDSNSVLNEFSDISGETASSEQIRKENPVSDVNQSGDTANQFASESPKPNPDNIPENKSAETVVQTASAPESPKSTGIDYSNFDYDNAEKIKTQRFHIVGKNETLSEISRLYYHSPNQWQKIIDANPELKDPNKIKPGMKLIIP